MQVLTNGRLADNDLSARLESEIKHELEAAADEAETPDFVKEFTKSGIWTVGDSSSSYLHL